MELLITFIILNIANVIIQTVKSIATIKCGKTVAALVNAIAYGLYTIVIVYTNADLNLWVKVAVVAIANLIGVYVVKLFEEKSRKDKLWKIEATVYEPYTESLHNDLSKNEIPHNYIDIGPRTLFNFYCSTKAETSAVIKHCRNYKGKFFAVENKL